MIKRLILGLSIFINFDVFSQTETLPRYFVENGDTLGVILTIKQAEKIYNQQVLLELYEGYKFGCDSLSKKYYIIVNEYERKQLVDKNLIEQLERNVREKENTCVLINDKNKNLQVDLEKCDAENKLRDGKISDMSKIIDELKNQRRWLLGSAIGFGSFTLFMLGVLATK